MFSFENDFLTIFILSTLITGLILPFVVKALRYMGVMEAVPLDDSYTDQES